MEGRAPRGNCGESMPLWASPGIPRDPPGSSGHPCGTDGEGRIAPVALGPEVTNGPSGTPSHERALTNGLSQPEHLCRVVVADRP